MGLNKQTEKNLVRFEDVLTNVAENLEFVLDELGLEYRKNGPKFSCKCPIHDSNQYKCDITIKHGVPRWKCYTRRCEHEIGSGFVNFVAAIRHCRISEALNWLVSKVGKNSDIDESYIQKRKEILQYSNIPASTIQFSENIIDKLQIPSPYFLGRGFSKDILIKYEVGSFHQDYHVLNNRATIPIRNKEGILIGATGRAPYGQCNKCELFHDTQFPCPPEYSLKYAKWIFTKGFRADEYFFNEWLVVHSGTIILVEGCGDCLKLVQAGYNNALALFGINLSPTKKLKLIKMGVMNIILLLDNDDAGTKTKSILYNELSKSFNVVIPSYNGKDVGELCDKQINLIMGEL